MQEFETIKITDIKPAEYNPRTIQEDNFQKLKQSLDQFGLVDPIIINLKNDNTIIGGHQRYQALLEKHEDEQLYLIRLGDIGWVFDSLELKVDDDSMEKALNISLNQNNLSGEWDNNKLKGIFVDLKLEEVDLNITGFNDLQINDISPVLGVGVFKSEPEKNQKTPPARFTSSDRKPPSFKKKKEKTPLTFVAPKPKEEKQPDKAMVVEKVQSLPKPKPKRKNVITVHLKKDEEADKLYEELMNRGYLCTIT